MTPFTLSILTFSDPISGFAAIAGLLKASHTRYRVLGTDYRADPGVPAGHL